MIVSAAVNICNQYVLSTKQAKEVVTGVLGYFYFDTNTGTMFRYIRFSSTTSNTSCGQAVAPTVKIALALGVDIVHLTYLPDLAISSALKYYLVLNRALQSANTYYQYSYCCFRLTTQYTRRKERS